MTKQQLYSNTPDSTNREQILWFLSLAKPEIHLISIGFLTLLVSTIFNLCIPSLSGSLVDTMTTMFATEERHTLAFQNIFLYMILIILGTGITTFIRNYCMTVAGERIVSRLNKQLFKTVVNQEVAFFDATNTADLVNRLADDSRSIKMALSLQAEYICRHCVEIIGCIIVLLSLSVKLLLFMLLFVPGITIAMRLMGRYVGRISSELQDALARSSIIAQETLSNMRTVKSLGIQNLQTSKYSEAVDEAYQKSNRLAIADSISMSFSIMMGILAICGVLWFGGKLVISHEITVGELASFLAYTGFLSYSINNLSHWYFSMLRFLGSTRRIYQLLNRKPLIDNVENAVQLPGNESITVQFENVSFTYPTRPTVNVLKDINLTLTPGKIIALVGISGGGKSTICNLVQRFYDPTEGRILVNGIDLKQIDLKWISRHVGTVSQEPHLFATTIRENISYGKIQSTEEDIVLAAKQANAHTFIEKFPDQYDTDCGEKGTLMSGGQKQRIALARCFVQQPEVILIDEGTSALDSESEFYVQKAFAEIAKGRSVLMIAHRLSTIKMADEICVIKDGTITERGSHDQLIQMHGIYHRLVRLQELQSKV